jgi:hypothetical protein
MGDLGLWWTDFGASKAQGDENPLIEEVSVVVFQF